MRTRRLIAWLEALEDIAGELLIATVFGLGLVGALVAGEVEIALRSIHIDGLPVVACSHCER